MVTVVDLQIMSELQLATDKLWHGGALQFTKQLKKRLHLVDQIRNAGEIILNKCDLMSQDLTSQFRAMLNQINAHAPIHETISANIDTPQTANLCTTKVVLSHTPSTPSPHPRDTNHTKPKNTLWCTCIRVLVFVHSY